jgi:hypothetical protein
VATNPIIFPGRTPEPKKETAKRRGARGRGSVFQPSYTVKLSNGESELRKSKLWWIRFTDPITKKRVSQKTNFTKKAGAEKLLTDLMSKSDRGETCGLHGIPRSDVRRNRGAPANALR